MRTAIVAHSRWCQPEEACGLIAVDATGRLRMVYPMTNAERSPTRFTIEPGDQFGAVSHAETQGWQIGGVFHSHPGGAAIMSAIDLTQPHDSTWFHIVVGLRPSPELRAWHVIDGKAREILLLT